MPEELTPTPPTPGGPARSKDEIALELMKFISIATGYGKGATSAGYGARPSRTSEEHADALLELFDRCRKAIER